MRTVTQEQAKQDILPSLIVDGLRYNKFTQVLARPAIHGERIDTITSDGKETTNVANSGDWVVENQTEAREQYILTEAKFTPRYDPVGDVLVTGWQAFQAKGSVIAMSHFGSEFTLVADWGETMPVKPMDMLCTPYPGRNEVYRIAAKEFHETYKAG